MYILMPEEIRDFLRLYNINAVARATGLHENSIGRFMRDEVDTRVSTLIKLSEFVKQQRGERE